MLLDMKCFPGWIKKTLHNDVHFSHIN